MSCSRRASGTGSYGHLKIRRLTLKTRPPTCAGELDPSTRAGSRKTHRRFPGGTVNPISRSDWRHGQEIGKRTRNEPCNRKLRKLGSDEDGDSLRNFVVLMNRRHVRRCGAGDGRGNDEEFHRGSSRDERPVATTPVVNSYTAAVLLLRTNEKETSTAPAPAPVARVDSASPSLHAVTEI